MSINANICYMWLDMLEYYFAGFKMQVTVFLSFSGGTVAGGTVARADYCSTGQITVTTGKITVATGKNTIPTALWSSKPISGFPPNILRYQEHQEHQERLHYCYIIELVSN